MKSRLYKIGESYYIQPSDGELTRINRMAARHYLLNFKAPEFSEHPEVSPTDVEDYGGDTIAEVVEGNYLLVKNEILFKTLMENDGVVWVSVNDFAQLHMKSPAMVRRHCQNGRIEGAIATPGGYIIPEDASYPTRG